MKGICPICWSNSYNGVECRVCWFSKWKMNSSIKSAKEAERFNPKPSFWAFVNQIFWLLFIGILVFMTYSIYTWKVDIRSFNVKEVPVLGSALTWVQDTIEYQKSKDYTVDKNWKSSNNNLDDELWFSCEQLINSFPANFNKLSKYYSVTNEKEVYPFNIQMSGNTQVYDTVTCITWKNRFNMDGMELQMFLWNNKSKLDEKKKITETAIRIIAWPNQNRVNFINESFEWINKTTSDSYFAIWNEWRYSVSIEYKKSPEGLSFGNVVFVKVYKN